MNCLDDEWQYPLNLSVDDIIVIQSLYRENLRSTYMYMVS